MTKENELTITLKCPVGVSREDYYLTLIDFLVDKLQNHIPVKIIGDSILQEHRLCSKIRECENTIEACKQKLLLIQDRE